MKRTLFVVTASLAASLIAGPALAHHQHTLTNPGTSVTFKCEPAAAADLHPIHNGMHMGLKHSGTTKVSVAATGTCVY